MTCKKYIFGDTAVCYIETPDFGAGLALLPASLPVPDPAQLCCDGMVQAALRELVAKGAYPAKLFS